MSRCSVCGSETVLRFAQDWCHPCQAWVVDVSSMIDLRVPSPRSSEDLMIETQRSDA